MSRVILAGLLALPLLLATGERASAQAPCPNFGCGGFCMNLFGKIHQHGPLFNYGPYQGYYPFEPYGPWTSDLRYNPPAADCGNGNCGRNGLFSRFHDGGWKLYSLLTFDNIRKRTCPSSLRCGTGGCSTCGGSAIAAPAAGCAGCSAKIDIPIPAVVAIR
jgi:hypothetical protein